MVAVIKVSYSAEASSALRHHSAEITGTLRKGAMGFSIHCQVLVGGTSHHLATNFCHPVCQLQEKNMEQVCTTGLMMSCHFSLPLHLSRSTLFQPDLFLIC